MSSAYANCTNCGAALSPEDYMQPACRYCGTAYRHHQEAAAKAAQVQAVMQGFSAQVPPGFASPQQPPAVVVVPGMQPIVHVSTSYVVGGPALGASPPMTGGPAGGAPMGAPPGWNGQQILITTPANREGGWLWLIWIVIPLLGGLIGLAAAIYGWWVTR